LMRASGSRKRGISGLTPTQQLQSIRQRATRMTEAQYALLNEQLLPAMKEEGMVLLNTDELTPHHHEILAERFQQSISPLLTPLAYSEDSVPPSLPALKIIIACELLSKEKDETRIVLIPVPDHTPRFLHIQSNKETDKKRHTETLKNYVLHYHSE